MDQKRFDALTALWSDRWGGAPSAYELKDRFRDRWVRFHSLPGSKRYPDTEEQLGVVLGRHHTILQELGTAEGLYVIADSYHGPEWRWRPDRSLHPDAVLWYTLTSEDGTELEPATEIELRASWMPYEPALLDPLLRAVADDQLGFVILAPSDLRWLYHPYDGGADLITSTVQERDAFEQRHSAWLSSHPLGL
ncbi:DUF3885 domain-containing protein [Actinoallomurus iriomotensis]|uniref:DUF3885 domain-containing protein n=1 Tax=Actinoallomurus iriomotensis TaxID=478107 RepID=A0A9W6RKQ5_9ACTN|nr:hypothetical protein [Actinoallomurus iriomotensis]GLY75797.1 hypothetical protein Airi01_040640 [Actinoallomurus iriomotensis]